MHITIEQIENSVAEQLCRQITADLPDFFGLPEANEHYAIGVRSKINFGAKAGDQLLGLLSLEFPYPKNSNIYWMGIMRKYQRQGIGQLLVDEAVKHAIHSNASTMTVETLSPSECDENYLKTYSFYKKLGFNPLFNLKPQGYEWTMAYMALNLKSTSQTIANTDITIRPLTDKDISFIVNQFKEHQWEKPKSTFERYLKEQSSNERLVWLAFYQNQFAGYITLKWDSLYPSFKQASIPEIMDLNVLPPYRNQGIASSLMNKAEQEILKKSDIAGIGVGLYDGYGNAQKLYINRGYLPDGLGITYNYKRIDYDEQIKLDDDLVLWFTKKLSNKR